MATDPAVLGLSIELQMNTMLAEKALGSLSNDVLKLSSDIDKQLNAALNSTKSVFEAIGSSSAIIKSDFKDIFSSAQSFADAVATTADSNKGLSDTFDSINTAYTDISANVGEINTLTETMKGSLGGALVSSTKLSDDFTNIELKSKNLGVNVASLSDALNTALDGSKVLADINISFDTFIKNIDSIKEKSDKMYTGFDEYYLKFDKYNKEYKLYEEAVTKIELATKTSADSFKLISIAMAAIQRSSINIRNSTSATGQYTEAELGLLEDHLKIVNQITTAIDTKNESHAAEAAAVESEGELVRQLKREIKDLNKEIEENKTSTQMLAYIWGKVVNEAKKIDGIAENFRESTYRSVGSMYELADISAQVSLSSGIAAAESAKMVKELINVKTGKKDLVELATTMVQLEKMTGLSGKSLAGATRTLKNMGFSVEKTKETMLGLADSMAKFGLEGQDVQVMVDLMQQRFLLFGSKLDEKVTASVNRATAAQLAMAKSVGVSTDVVKKMNSTAFDDLVRLEALSGVAIEGPKDIGKAHIAMAMEVSEAFKEVGDDTMAASQLMEVYKSRQISEEQVAVYRKMAEEMAKAGIDPNSIDAQELLNKAMEDSKSVGDKFNASMGTLSSQLSILAGRGGALIIMFIKPFFEFVTMLVTALNNVIEFVIYLGAKLGEFSNYIGSIIPFWNLLVAGFQWGVYIFSILVVGAILLGASLAALMGPIVSIIVWLYSAATTVGFFSNAVTAATTRITTFIQSMVGSVGSMLSSLATSVGQAFNTFVGYISSGIDKLASAARTAAVPILILSVALLITAGAMWVMAQALVVVSGIEYNKIAAGLGFFGVMLLIFGLTMGYVLPLLTMAQPVLLGLAVVVLAFGAAALMAAVGIYIIAQAFMLIASVLTPQLAGSVALLALSLTMLVFAMYLFMPAAVPFAIVIATISGAMIVFAVACLILALALIPLAYGLYLISQSMTPGIAVQLKEFGKGLWEFCKAVGIVGTAALAAIGVAMLPLAMGMLFLAAAFALAGDIGGQFTALAAGITALTKIDAGAIGILAQLGMPLADFSSGVAAIAQAMSTAGPGFAANFTSVADGVSALLKAISAVDPAAIGLLSSLAQPLQDFGAGVSGLVASMSGIDPAALAVFAATATTISTSINALASIDMAKVTALGGIAVPLEAFSQAIQSLSNTFISLDLAFLDTAKLAVAGLKEVAVILESAAAPLVAGAFGLLIGAMVLNSAVAAITSGIDALATAVTSLASISPILLQSSGEILTSGNNLWYGAFALLRGAYLLLSTAPILISASTMISASTGVLLQASFVLMIFANGLMVAGTSAMEGATALFNASGLLRDASAILLTTGPELLTAMVQLQAAIPIISSIAYGMMTAGAVLYSGAMSIYFASMFLGVAVTKIAEYTQTLNDFADPLERLAASFGGLAASMMLIKDAVSGLSALPLAAIIESFQKFSPTDEALEKVKSLSLALEKIGVEYSKAITDESRIASELTSGKPTTLTNPAVENEEDPVIKTNELLGDSKETLDKILEALKPKDQRNSTNFGLSLFGSPRGFEI